MTYFSYSDEVSLKGEIRTVPALEDRGRKIIVTGTWLRIAAVKDEDLFDGQAVDDPESFVQTITLSALKADIFAFSQNMLENNPRFDYYMEWDNAAAIQIESYSEWWETLPQETRKNVRKALRLGVEVRVVEFNDELVRGIAEIYNESSIRQGRPFWHYGKEIENVRRENATYVERSEFIGAFDRDELIGFIKMVYVGKVASIMQILAKKQHHDKKSSNAMIAKAVEICETRGMSHLIYGRYVYGRNNESALTEFKRRNGFKPLIFPAYFVPLTVRGKIALKLNLHHGIKSAVPNGVMTRLLSMRSRLFEISARLRLEALRRKAP